MTVKLVKSVARVLEILELFNEVQEPLPAIDVAERLNYPLASTHEILKTMVALGFFSYGDPKWTFKPSARFPEVVDWVRDSHSRDSNLDMLMEALNLETQETINLSQIISYQVKIIKGLECLHEIGVSSKPGTVMDTTLSLTGIVALSHLSELGLEEFYRGLKERNPEAYQSTNFNLISNVHDELREVGYSMRTDINITGIGAVCCPIISNSGKTYVIGVVGPSRRVQESKALIIRTLKTQVRRCSVKSKYPIKLR